MKQSRFFLAYAVWLLALVLTNPSLQAAKKKRVVAKKENPARVLVQHKDEHFQEKIEQEIADLRTDVYTRATWKELQKVKQEADDAVGSIKVMTLVGTGIGFVLGCMVAGLVGKRMGKADDALKIT
jgi:hypothetical protein